MNALEAPSSDNTVHEFEALPPLCQRWDKHLQRAKMQPSHPSISIIIIIIIIISVSSYILHTIFAWLGCELTVMVWWCNTLGDTLRDVLRGGLVSPPLCQDQFSPRADPAFSFWLIPSLRLETESPPHHLLQLLPHYSSGRNFIQTGELLFSRLMPQQEAMTHISQVKVRLNKKLETAVKRWEHTWNIFAAFCLSPVSIRGSIPHLDITVCPPSK